MNFFMKTVYDIYNESILDDVDTSLAKGDKDIKAEIHNFIKANYSGRFKISAKPNRNGLYEVSSKTNIRITNPDLQQLTNGMFDWTSIDEIKKVSKVDNEIRKYYN